ncbi:MAG: hypothetical protein Q4F23_03805, partial [Coriobacteriia bacterium]|nr:hypothetical protein [Coriobacteriia bacterium]
CPKKQNYPKWSGRQFLRKLLRPGVISGHLKDTPFGCRRQATFIKAMRRKPLHCWGFVVPFRCSDDNLKARLIRDASLADGVALMKKPWKQLWNHFE